MTFRQLQAALAVAKSGSIAAAAKALGLTPSGVSRAISELELSLGFDVFLRVGRGLQTTSQGESFLREAGSCIENVDRLGRVAEEIRLGFEQRISISCLPSISMTVLPGAVASFRRKYPNTIIRLHTDRQDVATNKLVDRSVDCGICRTISEIEGIELTPLAAAEVMVAMQSTHDLASKATISEEEFAAFDTMGHMSAQSKSASPANIELSSTLTKHSPQRIWCHSSPTRYACIAAGLGISLVEPFTAPLYRSQDVVVRPFERKITIDYCFAVPAYGKNQYVTEALLHSLRSEIVNYASANQLPINLI